MVKMRLGRTRGRLEAANIEADRQRAGEGGMLCLSGNPSLDGSPGQAKLQLQGLWLHRVDCTWLCPAVCNNEIH